MKITARVTFNKSANREYLVQAFFDKKEYSSKNKIWIADDKVAFVQLEFDNNPPQGILKAISHCTICSLDNMDVNSIELLMDEYYGIHRTVNSTDISQSVCLNVCAEDVNESQKDKINEELTEIVDEDQNSRVNEAVEEVDGDRNGEVNEAVAEEVDGNQNGEVNEAVVEEVDGSRNEEVNEAVEEEVDGKQNGEVNEAVAEEVDGNHNGEVNEAVVEEVDGSRNGEVNEAVEEEVDGNQNGEVNEAVEEEVDGNQNGEVNEATEGEIDKTKKGKVIETEAKNVDDVNTSKELHVKKRRYGLAVPSEDDYLDIPQFEDMSKSVTNFSDFVNEVSKLMRFSDDDATYFFSLVSRLSTLDQKGYELRSKQIKEANKAMGSCDYRVTKFSKTITTLLEKSGVDGTLLCFLATVLRYKEHYTNTSKSKDGDSISDDDHHDERTIKETSNNGIENPNDVVVSATGKPDESYLMNCEDFTRIINSIDKDATVEEKVQILFSKMELKKSSNLLYQKACKITVVALAMDNLESIDDVMIKAGMDVATKEGLRTKIKFSEWINDYNKAHHIKRMKIVAFLREIKAIFTLG